VNSQHHLFVCTTCASKWQNGRPIGTSGGKKLLDRLQQLQPEIDPNSEITITGVGCMSACSRNCAVAFTATGKHTYLFGDIPIDISDATLGDLLQCAKSYADRPTGDLPWAERPEPLKSGILAKIPPLATVDRDTIVAI
jgi:predicted metal-binding protein